ncbi:TonB-dependent receptor [Saccharibacter sp. 17.LH.SD]|uniref:TonB-dependent receptor n=1 Tax=Saccharibacter sp. 17.LH.SD TaxID=2689393 RepID=UPI00136CEEDA|nr:TonB-dependent receptor [Saccharibacter sp. 17.LH.SD]MXV44860.1 TonB-dependent receptor [Saccharibacter sp. 17.LH.SD]
MSRFVRHCLKPVSAILTFGSAAGAQAEPAATMHSRASTAEESHADKQGNPVSQQGSSLSVTSKNVEKLHVIGHPFNVLHASNDMGRMPQDVMHTAQTIDVVPRELMKQQNAKSLDEALKNVPGIAASVGEGAGGLNGDQFLIRGFPAQNDIYEDGLHDFGVYTRDNFNYDSIHVIKGPSSQVFGNGTTGGAINAVTKMPMLKNSISGDFSGGSGNYYRGTLGINRQFGEHSAFRIDGVGNSNNVIGRKGVFDHRWGIAPSIAFGLGTKTTVVFQIMHLSDKSVPDFGVPVVQARGSTVGRPITEYSVPRHNWYGKDQDRNKTSDTMETLRLTHHYNSHITFHNDLRFGEFSRDFTASKVQCKQGCINALNSGDFAAGEIERTTPGSSVPMPYKQWSWSVQNVASMQADFHTGFLKHQLVTGFDMEYVHDARHQYVYNKAVPQANLLNPDSSNAGGVYRIPAGNDPKFMPYIAGLGKKPNSTGYGFDTGIFLYDQIWFAKWISIKGGFRWDRWQSAYRVTGGPSSFVANGKTIANPDQRIPSRSDIINPTASLIITPNKWQMFYFTYASSTTPVGMYVTSGAIAVRPGKGGTLPSDKPQRAQLYEIGSKMSFFHDRLGATISLFRLDKSNALTTDPVADSTFNTGDRQRNQGLELSLGGMILPGWNITATYALYDPKVTSSSTPGNVGKRIQYVPHNQATLWSAYEAFPNTPWNITVGGGITWRQGVWLDNANTARAPANVEFDSTLSHRFNRHWSASLNGYNLANRLNYSSLFSGYATPAPGRTFLARLSMDY